MYSSLNLPGQLTKWSSSDGGDPCGESCKGITCSGNRVTEIDISNNNLGNQIPYQLPPNVQRLDISFNSMSGKLPQSFQSLTSMKKIYLQNNQFTGNVDVLTNLPLDYLDLENNQFTGGIPEKLKGIIHNQLVTDPLGVYIEILTVKKHYSSELRNPEDFIKMVPDISRLDHPNVTELVGYCSEDGQHLLVYEFHKNGSLYDFLNRMDEDSTRLTWDSRLKIALGTARALDGLANLMADIDQGLNHNTESGYGIWKVYYEE
ncbi:hypothetical protein K7X08_004202 [Anisodus acutangulus]|uniref:Protein kinase domain-containing protein n=1 Tax=Anisodus acutangulus TaxID=402998 RepID=A0A9Q1RJW8_9SOLA|nr:hypothetical protein K7X08_004202 [Anisodus acutangulus]